MSYDALLFDNDGVILERTGTDCETFEEAVRSAFRDHGVDSVDPDHVGDLVYGVTVPRLSEICESYGIDVEAFWTARDEECSRVQREAIRDGKKGLYSDVEVLREFPEPMGVVSTNQQPTLTFAFEYLDVPPFDVVRGRPMTVESLRRKKPEPYYLHAALGELGAETAIYVGDSEHDVVAAHNAGLDSAYLRRSHNRDTSLSVSPEYELDSLRDLSEIVG